MLWRHESYQLRWYQIFDSESYIFVFDDPRWRVIRADGLP